MYYFYLHKKSDVICPQVKTKEFWILIKVYAYGFNGYVVEMC